MELLFFTIFAVGGIIAGPVLTVINIYKILNMQSDKTYLDVITFIYGSFCVYFLYAFSYQYASYDKSISEGFHEPIFNKTLLTIVVFSLIGFFSYFQLKIILKKNTLTIPPLAFVLCLSGVYLGVATCIAILIQLSENAVDNPMILLLCLLPFNYTIYGITMILKISRIKAGEYKNIEYKNVFLNKCNRILSNSELWRTYALILFFPMLGVIVLILTLFGQQPDSMIKAFTYTSDWFFSTKIPPPNHRIEGHYLCTVAAGGHKKLVKPLRYGIRGGKPIIVNRQLCVANAFEQIIEERMPRFHHIVRALYDRYGLPASRFIRTPIAADIVYITMKPLEYMFLFVLYLFDTAPEKRIARQYTEGVCQNPILKVINE